MMQLFQVDIAKGKKCILILFDDDCALKCFLIFEMHLLQYVAMSIVDIASRLAINMFCVSERVQYDFAQFKAVTEASRRCFMEADGPNGNLHSIVFIHIHSED